jgi:hypothetical protein
MVVPDWEELDEGVGVGYGRKFIGRLRAARRKTGRNTGIVSTPLCQHILSCNEQRCLRRLEVGIGFERAVNQIVQRLRVEWLSLP